MRGSLLFSLAAVHARLSLVQTSQRSRRWGQCLTPLRPGSIQRKRGRAAVAVGQWRRPRLTDSLSEGGRQWTHAHPDERRKRLFLVPRVAPANPRGLRTDFETDARQRLRVCRARRSAIHATSRHRQVGVCVDTAQACRFRGAAMIPRRERSSWKVATSLHRLSTSLHHTDGADWLPSAPSAVASGCRYREGGIVELNADALCVLCLQAVGAPVQRRAASGAAQGRVLLRVQPRAQRAVRIAQRWL